MFRNLSAIAEALFRERPLVVAVVAGLAAVLFASGYLSRREAEILGMAEPAGVVVSVRDIAPGELIDGASIRVEEIARRFLQPGVLRNIDDAVGRIAAVPVRAGTQLTPVHARPASRLSGVAPLVPSGRRAFTVFLDEDLSGIVRPNDSVDVLATFDLGSDAAVRRTTLAIAEGAEVLAVGQEVADAALEPRRREEGALFGGKGIASPAGTLRPSATLSVTPAEAQALAFAQASGKLALALWPMGEEGSGAKAAPTTMATITGGHDELMPLKKGFREYRGR